jgi:hypothetical protein
MQTIVCDPESTSLHKYTIVENGTGCRKTSMRLEIYKKSNQGEEGREGRGEREQGRNREGGRKTK